MKMEFEDTGESQYTIEFARVAEDNKLLGTTRLLALDISKNGYINIGEFFEKMNDSDLQKYLNLSENLDDEAAAEVVLLGEMLSIGEGLEYSLSYEKPETMEKRISQLIMFLACESLYRKGLVKLYRENMSFGDDMMDKVIVEKIDD